MISMEKSSEMAFYAHPSNQLPTLISLAFAAKLKSSCIDLCCLDYVNGIENNNL